MHAQDPSELDRGNHQNWDRVGCQKTTCLSQSQETPTHQSILLIVALDGGQHQAQQLWDIWPQALILGQAVHHLHDDVAQLVLCMQKGVVSKKSLATSQGLLVTFVQLVLYSRKASPGHRHLLQHCMGAGCADTTLCSTGLQQHRGSFFKTYGDIGNPLVCKSETLLSILPATEASRSHSIPGLQGLLLLP